ncbi:hypothetical protein evm_001617 [Chilo suppressalis]|nr:hypothetical protein evm_001617 [Chilo suppressalis]
MRSDSFCASASHIWWIWSLLGNILHENVLVAYSTVNIFQVISAQKDNLATTVEDTASAAIFFCHNKSLLYQHSPLTTEEKRQLQIILTDSHTRSSKKTYNYYEMHILKMNKLMDWNKKIVLYVGAYLDHPKGFFCSNIKESYVKLGYNVWCLNTFHLTIGEFHWSSRKMRYAGYAAAEMLADLTNSGVLDPSRLELVGFSLGAHTAGYIGAKFQKLTGKKLDRITGIDPAGFCFRNQPPKYRLDRTDAEFVDVLRTDIAGYGSTTPAGHVEFYVNGGEFQDSGYSLLPCSYFCSHIRAFSLWIAALHNSDDFVGIKCTSVQQARARNCYDNRPIVTNVMGLKTDRSKPGIYYLPTTAHSPYYIGKPINVPIAGAQAFPMDEIGRLGHDPPRGLSADWWVLTTVDAAGTNGLTCLPKHR